jgi:hypothetical protein
MVWSYEANKADERQVFKQLFTLATFPPDIPITIEILNQAVLVICQCEIAAPQVLRDTLRRVIRVRESATKFFIRIGCADAGHESWLEALRGILKALDQHAQIVRGKYMRPRFSQPGSGLTVSRTSCEKEAASRRPCEWPGHPPIRLRPQCCVDLNPATIK